MAGFANLWANLNLNIQNFSSNLNRAAAQANQFAANLKGQINGGLVQPAKQSKFEFKDVARIVQGIMISKVFYSGLNAIRNCTNAVWEFSQELEYAQIAYSNLFGDTALADEFINVLEDFAATTPFSFSESEAAAKRLLAYGIEYKNVMYVMQGVLAASSMQNNPQVIESVSRAIGQIYTKGRLMNEEMRQLAEAGIPAYEILAEKLGLTQEQLQNLGKQAIPASVAINALVEGMTERFGGVVKASTTTMKGIISNIKDNAVMITSGIFEPMYNGIKSVLAEFGEFLFTLREIYATAGVGGVFENIFPEELHGTLRQFIANILNLLAAVGRLISALGGVLRPIVEALLRVFNAFAPIITIIINLLAALVSLITSNATAMKILTAMIAAAATMWVIFKVKALAATVVAGVITLISKALKGLHIMLTFVVAHPFWALLIALGGVLVGLSGGFGKLSNSISDVFKKLTAIGGVDPDKILLPSQEERASEIEKFNQALSGTGDAMDELADSTGKATKAAKGLLSFDEVFKLKEPDEGTDSGIEVPDFGELGDLGDLDISVPEIDDSFFDLFADDYVTKLIESLKEKIMGAGIGAAIGAALGGILGGPLGAKIGAIAGAIAGWFWDDLAEALGLTDVGKIALPITTGLGAIIGAIAGGPLGAALGAGIGAIAGLIIDEIARALETGDWSTLTKVATKGIITGLSGLLGYILGGPVGATIGVVAGTIVSDLWDGIAEKMGLTDIGKVAAPLTTGLGAVIGALIGGPSGAVLGATIGELVGWIIDEVARGFETGNWSGVATPVGVGLGWAIGSIMGGPMGGTIGMAIGALVGDIAGQFINGFTTGEWDPSRLGTEMGLGIGAAIGMIAGGPAGAAIGAGIGALVGWIGGLIVENWDAISQWFADTGAKIGEWFTGVVDSYNAWADETEAKINAWCDNTWNSITTWCSDTATAIGDWVTDAIDRYNNWVTETEDKINNWCDRTWNSITTWVSDTATAIGDWVTDTIDRYNTWATETEDKINTWCTNTWNSFTTWCSNTLTSIGDWVTNTVDRYNAWATETETKINTWCTNTWNSFTNWSVNTWNTISNWAVNTWSTFSNWVVNTWNSIANWSVNTWNAFSNWSVSTWNIVSNWAVNTWNTINNWVVNTWNSFISWINNILNIVSNGLVNIWNTVANWLNNFWSSLWDSLLSIGRSISDWWNGLWSNKKASVSVSTTGYGSRYGHASGGVFNREHVANFAEGNKAEAIIPLETESAMQPFVDAVANGLTATLAPLMAGAGGGQQQLQPLYVGTLIADDRGLRELERKMQVIRMQETKRRG